MVIVESPDRRIYAEVKDVADGVAVAFFVRLGCDHGKTAPTRRAGRAVFDQPFHVVLDAVADALEA